MSEKGSIPQLFYGMGHIVTLADSMGTEIALAEAACLALMVWVIS